MVKEVKEVKEGGEVVLSRHLPLSFRWLRLLLCSSTTLIPPEPLFFIAERLSSLIVCNTPSFAPLAPLPPTLACTQHSVIATFDNVGRSSLVPINTPTLPFPTPPPSSSSSSTPSTSRASPLSSISPPPAHSPLSNPPLTIRLASPIHRTAPRRQTTPPSSPRTSVLSPPHAALSPLPSPPPLTHVTSPLTCSPPSLQSLAVCDEEGEEGVRLRVTPSSSPVPPPCLPRPTLHLPPLHLQPRVPLHHPSHQQRSSCLLPASVDLRRRRGVAHLWEELRQLMDARGECHGGNCVGGGSDPEEGDYQQ